MTQRQIFKRLHLIFALVAAIPLLCASITGTALVFYKPASEYLNRPLSVIQPGPQRMKLQELMTVIGRQKPDLRWTGVGLPKSPGQAVQLWGRDAQDRSQVVFADPYRGLITGSYISDELARPTLMRWIVSFHSSLKAGRWGARVVGFSTIFLTFSVISGLYLWAPRGLKNLASRLRPRRSKSTKQKAYNWHKVLGFYSSIGLLIIALTGMTMAFHDAIDPLIYWLTGSQPSRELDDIPSITAQPFLDADALLQAATTHLQANYQRTPWPEYISLPSAKDATARVYFQESDDLYDLTLSHVTLNGQDGKLLEYSSPASRNRGERFLNWVAVLHFGTWGDVFGALPGWAGRILWVLLALMPFSLFISGLMFWKKPRIFRKPAAVASPKLSLQVQDPLP